VVSLKSKSLALVFGIRLLDTNTPKDIHLDDYVVNMGTAVYNYADQDLFNAQVKLRDTSSAETSANGTTQLEIKQGSSIST
jgi:hypothetical protein